MSLKPFILDKIDKYNRRAKVEINKIYWIYLI